MTRTVEVRKVPQNKETLDQVAAIMLLFGTPEQRAEAIKYAVGAYTGPATP